MRRSASASHSEIEEICGTIVTGLHCHAPTGQSLHQHCAICETSTIVARCCELSPPRYRHSTCPTLLCSRDRPELRNIGARNRILIGCLLICTHTHRSSHLTRHHSSVKSGPSKRLVTSSRSKIARKFSTMAMTMQTLSVRPACRQLVRFRPCCTRKHV